MLINSCFGVNVISVGDPLEIYTEKDGEVIFKKYSPMGELSSFAEQICESMYKTAGYPAAVCDRDGDGSPNAAVAVPILTEGDVLGCVVFLERGDGIRATDVEMKLATTVAGFLGRQMEA